MIVKYRKTVLAALALLMVFCSLGLAQGAPTLNGMALHVQLSKEQFIAALYLTTPTSNARDALTKEEDKAMELRILTDDLYARRFQRMWIEGIAINAGATEMERHAQNLANFSNLLKIKLVKGDILRIERSAAKNTTTVILNRQTLDTIADAHFFDLLLRTWLGPVPLSSEFKESLLGGGTVKPELAERFADISPTSARIAEIATLLKGTKLPEPARQAPPAPPAVAPEIPTPPPAVAVVPEPQAEEPQPEVEQPQTPPEPEKLLTEASLFNDEEILSDEEEDGFSFTAENLLSEQIYIAKLTKWTTNFVNYPRNALRNEHQGTVRLTVTLSRDGRVRDVQILEKSEHETLNKAAVKAVRSASPYPAVPDTIKGDRFLFTVPVVFRMN